MRDRGQLAGDSLDLCSEEPEVAQQSLGNMRESWMGCGEQESSGTPQGPQTHLRKPPGWPERQDSVQDPQALRVTQRAQKEPEKLGEF